MMHSHKWTYVHAGIVIELSDAKASEVLQDAKQWGYHLDSFDSDYWTGGNGQWHFSRAHFFFCMEKNGKLESFSFYREGYLSQS